MEWPNVPSFVINFDIQGGDTQTFIVGRSVTTVKI